MLRRRCIYNQRSWPSSFRESSLWGNGILPIVCLGEELKASSLENLPIFIALPTRSRPRRSCPTLPSADYPKGRSQESYTSQRSLKKKKKKGSIDFPVSCTGKLCAAGMSTHLYELVLALSHRQTHTPPPPLPLSHTNAFSQQTYRLGNESSSGMDSRLPTLCIPQMLCSGLLA